MPLFLSMSSDSADECDVTEATALVNDKADSDPEDAEKIKYPKSVFFIVSNEFCERFSYYGMRTILALYLRNILLYSDDDATMIYHIFVMMCYFFPILGAMLADSLLGKFRTIFYISIIYALGNVVVSFSSTTGAIEIPARELAMVGLFLIAFGTGGIKPCVAAFGGDQFKLPQQERQLAQFFSVFYFSINAGSLISTFVTPILRQDVTCLEQDTCYPLAFGVPAILMITALLIFLIGKRLYIIRKPEGNVVLQVCKCIGHALVRKQKLKHHEQREHWLDYADDKYDKTLISDTKATLRVLFLYLPLPVFWALFDQQGSRWTFQASRMTGELGSWSLKPDQMQVVNPLLILIFIPVFETVIYPLMAKCNIKRPLQKLGIGGVLAAVAFVISAIVELQLQDTYPVLPQNGEAQLRIYNGLNCPVSVELYDFEKDTIKPLDFWKAPTVSVDGGKTLPIAIGVDGSCDYIFPFGINVTVTEKEATSYFITTLNATSNTTELIYLSSPSSPYDTIDKSISGEPLVRVIYPLGISGTLKLHEVDGSQTKEFKLVTRYHATDYQEVLTGTYEVLLNDKKISSEETLQLKVGGVYTLLVQENDIPPKLLTVTEPNSVHMLWLIPQYFVITLGEVMFSITGLQFSFTQAPVSMKSVLQAGWLLTTAFGNVIVVIVAKAKFFDSQANEFFLFAGLMLVDMAIFAFMAMKYIYVEMPEEEDEEENKDKDVPLKEKKSGEMNGNINKSFSGD